MEPEASETVTPKKTPKKTPARVSSIKNKTKPLEEEEGIDLESVRQELEEAALQAIDTETMRIITIFKTNVKVKGFGASSYEDLLGIQVVLPPGCVLRTVRIEIDEEDPNHGIVSCDEDPYLLEGARRVKKDWKKMNHLLASELEALFDKEAKDKYAVEGTTPSHGKLIQPFKWPEEFKSHLNPIDPFVLGLRALPTDIEKGESFFDTKTLTLYTSKGKAVSATVLTAFFFVNKHSHIKNYAGRGLRVGESSDTESEGSVTPSKRSKRKRSSNGSRGSSGHVDPMDTTSSEVPRT